MGKQRTVFRLWPSVSRRLRPHAWAVGCWLALGLPGSGRAQGPLSPQDYRADFDFFWETVRDNYAYFDRKQTDWNRVRAYYRPQVDTLTHRRAFVRLLERALAELYDNHAGLGTNRPDSQRLVPTGSDIYAEWVRGQACVLDVRRGFRAARAGVRPGMTLTAINGQPVARAIEPFLPRCLRQADPAARNYALNQALAGDHQSRRQLNLATASGAVTARPDEPNNQLEPVRYPGRLTTARYGDIGYVKINNCLGDKQLITALDSTLNALRGTHGLVLDLRETPSGGDSYIARAIMGRFITREQPYQRHELPAEERETGIRRSWLELVAPRSPTYAQPLVVLAGRWTGSMGEGLAVGLAAVRRTPVVGTALARLAGAVGTYRLPRSGISFNIPFERVYLVDGQPREQYLPPVRINPAGRQSKNPTVDASLNVGLALCKAAYSTRLTKRSK